MLERKILKLIADRLVGSGSCPADPYCLYAGTDRCMAPADALEAKLSRAEKAMREQTGGLVMRNMVKPSPWPCNDLIAVVFVDSDCRDWESWAQ